MASNATGSGELSNGVAENGNGGDASRIDGIEIVEPSDIGGTASGNGSDSGSAAPKRRGRKPGSGKQSASGNGGGKTKAAQVSVTGIEAILLSLHGMAAAALKTPELNLDEKEAQLLAKSVAEVASHYNVEVDPKVMAWVGFFGVCGSIYGPRIAAAKIRREHEKREASQRFSQQQAPQPFQSEVIAPGMAEGGIIIPGSM